jgi:hypothetical protein
VPAPVGSPELLPTLHQFLREQSMKVFLEVAFISNQPPELAGLPSLLDRIKRCIVNKTMDVPVWIA